MWHLSLAGCLCLLLTIDLGVVVRAGNMPSGRAAAVAASPAATGAGTAPVGASGTTRAGAVAMAVSARGSSTDGSGARGSGVAPRAVQPAVVRAPAVRARVGAQGAPAGGQGSPAAPLPPLRTTGAAPTTAGQPDGVTPAPRPSPVRAPAEASAPTPAPGPSPTPRSTGSTSRSYSKQRPGPGCDGRGDWRERRVAEAARRIRLSAEDLGYTTVVRPARKGMLGMADSGSKTVTLYVRDCTAMGDVDLAYVLGHELAHVLDFSCPDPERRASWLRVRQSKVAWWPGKDARDDLSHGAGDFAEAFAVARTGSRAMWASRVGKAPSAQQLSAWKDLLRPSC